MSNQQQIWALGGQFTIKAQALDVTAATGVYTNNALAQQVFNGRVISHNEALEMQDDAVSPTDCPMPDPVTYETVFRFTVDELETLYVIGNSADSRLDALVTASFYARFLIEKYDKSNAPRSGSSGFLRRTIIYAKFIGWNRDVPKEKAKISGTFQAVPISDGAGGWKVNPYFTSVSATVDIP